MKISANKILNILPSIVLILFASSYNNFYGTNFIFAF